MTAKITNIDRLGDIRAQIADLKAVEEVLVAEIKALGAGLHDGGYYRANVIEVDARAALDAKAMELKLREMGVDGRWFAKNTKPIAGYISVKVAALAVRLAA